jgi:hypothetical protein
MSRWPRYLATARREEARLTMAAGDTSATVTLLNRCLALRHNAEPRAKDHDAPLARLLAKLDQRGSD